MNSAAYEMNLALNCPSFTPAQFVRNYQDFKFLKSVRDATLDFQSVNYCFKN